MSQSSSAVHAPTKAAPESVSEPRKHPAAMLVPDWHGRYQARRMRQRSDPKILRFLITMAGAAVIGAAILFSYLLLQDLKQTDHLRAEVASLEVASATNDVLVETEALIRTVAPALAAYSTDPEVMDASTRRQYRRDLFTSMDNSAVVGLVMVNTLGEILFEIGDAERVSVTSWAKLPLEPGSQLLGQRVTFLRSEAGQGVRALFHLLDQDRVIIASIDSRLLTDALTPKTGPVQMIYLHDNAGRILAASKAADPAILVGSRAQRDSQLEQDSYSSVRIRSGDAVSPPVQAATQSVGVSDLRVIATSPPISVARFFGAVGDVLAAGLGLVALTIGFLIYVIHSEWKKHDRRVSFDEDMIARTEIAADIMDAGIIDWRVSDAVISYSEGWQRLFSKGCPTGDEEIFDWIDKLHPDSQKNARENYQDLLEGRVFEVDHEIAVRCRDGDYITVRERGRARLDAAGKASRIVLVQWGVDR